MQHIEVPRRHDRLENIEFQRLMPKINDALQQRV
jgi:hypothetical protein